jgi:hypothetical protein
MKKILAILLLLVVYPAYSQDYTYSQVQVPLQNINTSGGTNLQLGDDGMAYDVRIGFDFEFYGNIFDTVNISNNGFLTFTGLNSMCCNGTQLPAWGMDNSIMGLWTDLISINGTNPYYKSYAVDGDRVFTVGWYNTIEFYNTSATNTFEISLFQGSNNILFNYGDVNIFNHTLTIGLQGTNGQFQQIYTGTNADQFDNTAYLFTYQPIIPETPIAIDCTTNPTNINCIIQSYTSPSVYVAETDIIQDSNNNNDIVDITEQQIFAGTIFDLESLLSDNQTVDLANEDEEKLKDNISLEILEQVLAVVETPVENERNNRNNNTEETELVQYANLSETTVEFTQEDDTVATTDTIEETYLAENTIETTIPVSVENNVVENNEVTTNDEIELLANNDILIENTEETTDVIELPIFVQNNTESMLETISVDYDFDGNVSEEQFVQNTIEQSITIDQEITNTINYVANQQDDEFEELNNILAMTQQKTFGDEENTDEMLTMTYVQPGLFNITQSFNTDSNMADKEASGIFGKVEDKSDAEKRAIEIIAANKEQQDSINSNYMDADQSGILGAMIVDTDVSAYRTSNIPDLSSWYKPEDIYKNIVYRDNVRGMYFLEKGSTDTYKQMVDEQYK